MDLLEPEQILRFFAALILVLGLMGGLALAMKYMNKGRFTPAHKRRLSLVEVLPLDARRKAVIVRRDDKEHLIILGTNGETLVESGFESPQDRDHDPEPPVKNE